MLRIACGRIISRIVCKYVSPVEEAASIWPEATEAIPARTTSARYAEMHPVSAITAATYASIDLPARLGTRKYTQKMTINCGTLRSSSTYKIATERKARIRLSRASANTIPTQSANEKLKTASFHVSASPVIKYQKLFVMTPKREPRRATATATTAPKTIASVQRVSSERAQGRCSLVSAQRNFVATGLHRTTKRHDGGMRTITLSHSRNKPRQHEIGQRHKGRRLESSERY